MYKISSIAMNNFSFSLKYSTITIIISHYIPANMYMYFVYEYSTFKKNNIASYTKPQATVIS